MKNIIDAIDQRTFELLGVGKFYGLCTLVVDADRSENYPRTDVPTGAEKVTPNDKYPVAIYHRLLEGGLEENTDISFGRSIKKQNNQRIRTIVIIDFKSNVSISEVYEAIPEEVILCDYKSVLIPGDMGLITDQNSLWEQEWSTAYKDKYQMRYKIYALEYAIQYVKCKADVCC